MAGQEAGSKLVRLLAFVGAGVVCTAAINTWRDVQRKFLQQKAEASEKKSPGLGQFLVRFFQHWF
uniref:Uncharacterized protein n=1 Tax=Nelumbo nucifera TaxID=4432 RepID=A0A822XPW8_NELNU|nr:TPA_asm: hypothetical protein HUJ06_022694 [Nelumbo nucifera]